MQQYTYRDTLAATERVNWRVEDLIGGDRQLDFRRPFLPEALARTDALTSLSPAERLALNQIRGHTYLAMFGIVEEFIVPFVLDHVRGQLDADDYKVRSFLEFAAEEAKHIHLFRRFRQEFQKGFGTLCGVIGPAEAIAKEVLRHEPLAVALAILHIEWMTQRHYIDSVQDDRRLDDRFKSLLRHHWMEEAQHAKLDTLMVEALAAARSASQREAAVEEYLEIGAFLDAGLQQQVDLDIESLARATNRRLADAERDQVREVQLRANRWTYLGSGMTHPAFVATLQMLGPGARERIESVAPAFC